MDFTDDFVEYRIAKSTMAEEIVDFIRSGYGGSARGILLDFSEKGSLELISRRADYGQAIFEAIEAPLKLAFISNMDFEFGLLRMYESQSKIRGSSVKTRVFRSRDEATLWLCEVDLGSVVI